MTQNMMLSIFLQFGIATVASAAVNLGPCGGDINQALAFNTMAVGDVATQSPFLIKDNHLSIRDKSIVKTSEIGDNKETYTYSVDLGNGIQETRMLELTRDDNGHYSLVQKNDLAAQKEAAKKNGMYTPGSENYLMSTGTEMHFATTSGRCTLAQAVTLKTLNGQKALGEVYVDQKYCDAVQAAVQKTGKQKTQQCVDLLQQVENQFQIREAELGKEHKTFGTFDSGAMGAASKLVMCSPKEMQIRTRAYGFGFGNPNGKGMGMQMVPSMGFVGGFNSLPTAAPAATKTGSP